MLTLLRGGSVCFALPLWSAGAAVAVVCVLERRGVVCASECTRTALSTQSPVKGKARLLWRQPRSGNLGILRFVRSFSAVSEFFSITGKCPEIEGPGS